MKLSQRAQEVSESITLKLNEKATKLTESGHLIYNLTAGQLPFRPMAEFVEKIEAQLRFLKSFQYPPVNGISELRKKIIKTTEKKRGITLEGHPVKFDCIISNGTKHSLYNLLGTIINPGDEVILFSPYWVSYPEMVRFWGGTVKSVVSQSFDGFIPSIEELRLSITNKTKAIILNSPNNPTGVHYSESWMRDFGQLMLDYPDVFIISDELYHELYYYDPAPRYFYQFYPELLPQTVIVDGISKSLASTGLRVGHCIADKEIIDGMGKIQGQTTSGANSLIQRAMNEFDFYHVEEFLIPVKHHLRKNAEILREKFREKGLASCWYQSTSAFYFMLDYARTPMFKRYALRGEGGDYSQEISEKLLDECGVAVVPGSDFGYSNSARISIVLEEGPFAEAMDKLVKFLIEG